MRARPRDCDGLDGGVGEELRGGVGDGGGSGGDAVGDGDWTGHGLSLDSDSRKMNGVRNSIGEPDSQSDPACIRPCVTMGNS